MDEHNRRRALADTVSVDAWKGEMNAKGKFALHVDVAFGVARLGGEVEEKARFRLSLKRAEVVVVIPPTEPAKVDKASVARSENASAVIKDVETRQSEGGIGGGVDIDLGVDEKGPKGKVKASATAKASKFKKAVTTITRQTAAMVIVQSQTADGDYRWSISGAVNSMLLDGKPWSADKAPRMKVIDTRRDRTKGIEPSVRVEVRCLRDDLEISHIVLKDEKKWASLLQSPTHRNRVAAAEAVIRDRLFKAGLVHGELDEPYAQMCLPTAIRDAVAYFAADWERTYSFARDAQFSIFLRAIPTRTSPDPWLQLYSWAVLLGIQAEPGLRIGLPRDRPRHDSPDFGDLLFKHLEWQGGRLPEFAKFTAAALIEHGQRKFRVATSYGLAVERILEAQGWRVEKLEEASPTPLARVRVSSRAGSIVLNLAGADRVSRREHFSIQDLAGVQMDTVHIVATESADSATVVSRLVKDGELCVSVRDLADFEVRNGASAWDLIATVAMRVGRSGDFDQRTQFLIVLVMRALREIPGSTEANFLEPLFQQRDFFDVARLRVLGGG